MAKLTTRQAYNIVESILKDGRTYSRYIHSDYFSKKIGWRYKEDKSRITVITSELHQTAPYNRYQKRITIYADKPGNDRKLKMWATKIFKNGNKRLDKI